jgi:glycerol kinase
MAEYILAIDQGTTSTRCLVLDKKLAVRGQAGQEFPQIYPKPGWVSHDLEAIWKTVGVTVKRALQLAHAKASQIVAIGITNQRETTGIWERETGRPIAHAIVWQCRRTADACRALKEQGRESLVRAHTGLVLDPYFSATKIAWLLDNVQGARERADKGELAFGTIDTFLVWRLTAGQVHATDVSNASRTSLLNLDSLAWDDILCGLFNVPKAVLPVVRSSSEVYGTTKGLRFLPDGIPVAGIAGDQQAALFGQACFDSGEAKCTYGTGAFLLMNVGPRPIRSQRGLLGTVGWKVGDDVTYAIEGSVFIAGAAVQWLRDGLGLIKKASDVEALAKKVAASGSVVFVPALAGLGAPHWRPDARGVIAGLSRDTTAAHLARATLEGIAFQIHDLIDAMRKDSGAQIREVKVDGGAVVNGLLMQFQADLLGVPIVRPKVVETTALGAACLGGLAVGFWKSKEEIRAAWKADRRFEPRMQPVERDGHLVKWRRAIERA